DESGSPGTILTFFPWTGAHRGRHGTGQVTVTAFAVPRGSLGWWKDRAKRYNVSTMGPSVRFEQEVLNLYDPDGLQLELIASLDGPAQNAARHAGIPVEHAIGSFHSVSLLEQSVSEQRNERTARLLTETMGFRPVQQQGNRLRYEVGDGGPGATVDLLYSAAEAPRGRLGAGTVHHIAWRTPDEEQQKSWQQELLGLDYNVTPILDRQYFQSIYFREPGGVLFEIATDGPGFAIDESAQELGGKLMLPPQYEPHRERIEAELPPLDATTSARIGTLTL
ncbi:MAG: ring-cleaving dioxygenase, partial [Bryobacteraceae bacterium]